MFLSVPWCPLVPVWAMFCCQSEQPHTPADQDSTHTHTPFSSALFQLPREEKFTYFSKTLCVKSCVPSCCYSISQTNPYSLYSHIQPWVPQLPSLASTSFISFLSTWQKCNLECTDSWEVRRDRKHIWGTASRREKETEASDSLFLHCSTHSGNFGVYQLYLDELGWVQLPCTVI